MPRTPTPSILSPEQNYATHTTLLSLYIQYTKMHLQDLLMEADIEEEKGIRWKRCKLKEKLIGLSKELEDI